VLSIEGSPLEWWSLRIQVARVGTAILSFAGAAFGAGVVLASLFGSRLHGALTGQRPELALPPRTTEFMGVDIGLAPLLALIPRALLVGVAAGVQWWLGIPWSAWASPFWGGSPRRRSSPWAG
jgi:hypothetical protein